VRWRGQWIYFYLLLEFQSSVDRYMAVRIWTYLGLLQQALIRAKQLPPSGRLPPALAIVLYNGKKSWNAAQQVADLLEPVPSELAPYQPKLRYWLIDIGRLPQPALDSQPNLAAAIFQLENSRTPEAMRQVIHALAEWLRAPEQQSLRRAITEWVRRVLMPSRLPGVQLGAVNDLVEVETMLAERVMEWTREWKQEGLEEGLEKGRQEGKAEEHLRSLAHERALLVRQTKKRFGEDCAQSLAPLLESIAEQERLDEIGEWIVEVDTAESLLAKVQAI